MKYHQNKSKPPRKNANQKYRTLDLVELIDTRDTIHTQSEYLIEQTHLYRYIQKYQIHQEYQQNNLLNITDILFRSNLFCDHVENKLFIIDLLWSKSTQKYCIKAMNNRKWIIDLDQIREKILVPTMEYGEYLYLGSILKFVGQFTNNITIYNECLSIVNKLTYNQNIIHTIAFNKYFRPVRTLIPEKAPDFNRIIGFRQSLFSNITHDINKNIMYWKYRIIHTYQIISKNFHCSNASLKTRQIYLLNSLIEFNKLNQPGSETIPISLQDLFATLDDIRIQFNLDYINPDAYKKIYASITNLVNTIENREPDITRRATSANSPEGDITRRATSANSPENNYEANNYEANKYRTLSSEISESDILQKYDTGSDIKIKDLLDMDIINGNNEVEINYIIETCINISDMIYLNKDMITIENQELIEALLFLIEKKMIGKKNSARLNMYAKINKNQWILDLIL